MSIICVTFRTARLHFALLTASSLALASCANAPSQPAARSASGATVALAAVSQFAQGPISTACNANNRQAASRQTCGCIQAAANLTLSGSQQKRGAAFFDNPEALQKMKLSDTAVNERFWGDWAQFSETAEAMCR